MKTVKLLIKITKDVLKKSAYCLSNNMSKSCAIAVAVRDIFPQATVGTFRMYLHNMENPIDLPPTALGFIALFDMYSPERRMNMKEFSFTIDVPEGIINTIGIDEIHRILANCETLELVDHDN